MSPGCAAGGAAVNGDGRTSARRRSWRVVEFLVATLVLFVVAVGAGATAARADWDSGQQHGSDQQQGAGRSQTADEGQFLNLANGQRDSVGSGTLAPDTGLRDIARWWAARMAAASDIFHNYNLPNDVHDDWYKLGENVGMGWSVDDLHQAFVKSPTHYQNLVDPAYGFVGIGVAYNSDGKIFVVFDFMDLQPPPAADAATQPAPEAASSGQGLTLTRHAATPAAPPVAHPAVVPPRASLPAALLEEDPPPAATLPTPAPARAPSPALTGVLTQLRALDHHTAAPHARAAATSTTTTTKPARKPRRGATVETKDAQTWSRPKPPASAQKPDHPKTPSDAAKLWLTPSYCDPKHPKGSCG